MMRLCRTALCARQAEGIRVAVCVLAGALLASLASAAGASEAPSPLSLAQAVDAALRNHGTVLVAGRQVSQAESGLTIARSSYWPQLLADWQYTFTDSRGGRRFTTLGGIPVGVGGSQEQHQTTLAASYTIFDSGLRNARLHEAYASLDSAASAFDLARVNLSFQAASDYLSLVHQQRAVQLSQEQVDQSKAHLALVEARIDAGLAAKVDRFPLEAELAQAQLGLVTAQNQVGQASIALRNTMGLTAGPPFQAEEPPASPEVSSLPSLEQALAAANRLRPDLLEAQAAVRVAAASLEQAQISARPVLSVGTTYVVKAEPAPSGKDLVLDAEMTFPIFDAGLRRAQASAARENLEGARLRLSQLQKDAEAQVAQARLAITTAWERITAAAVAVNAARQSLESAEARYKAGLAIPIEITDAQVAYYNAQLSAAAARYDYFTALAALRNAVGLPTRDFKDLAEASILQP